MLVFPGYLSTTIGEKSVRTPLRPNLPCEKLFLPSHAVSARERRDKRKKQGLDNTLILTDTSDTRALSIHICITFPPIDSESEEALLLLGKFRAKGRVKKETASFPKKRGRFDNWLPGTDSNRRQGG